MSFSARGHAWRRGGIFACFLVVEVIAADARDLVGGAEDQRNARMQTARSHVENAVDAVSGHAAGLLDQKGDRIGFVDVPQSSALVTFARVGGVKEYAAAHDDAIGVRHQRGDPAHVEILAARPVCAVDKIVDIGADRLQPVPIVRSVDRELARTLRNLQRDPRHSKEARIRSSVATWVPCPVVKTIETCGP